MTTAGRSLLTLAHYPDLVRHAMTVDALRDEAREAEAVALSTPFRHIIRTVPGAEEVVLLARKTRVWWGMIEPVWGAQEQRTAGHRLVYAGTDARDREPLTPHDSWAVRNHSPDGFSWGYAGSGPAQLALAICLQVMHPEDAETYYQHLKTETVARWQDSWLLSEQTVWLIVDAEAARRQLPPARLI